MEIGQAYFVVRWKDRTYPTPSVGEAAGCLVAFTDFARAREQANRFGEGTVIEHRNREEVMTLASEKGFHQVAVHKPGGYTLVAVNQ